MSSLLYQGAYATGLSEDEAQSTLEPIRDDPSEAELSSAPEFNAVESDDSGELVGLSPRVVGSHTHPSSDGKPFDSETLDLASATHNELIDKQVASSGTAASREVAGARGHGSIWWEEGIEPLNPANVYGNDYFLAQSLSANEGSGLYMNPPDEDNWAQQVVANRAESASRDAYMSTQYANFFGAK